MKKASLSVFVILLLVSCTDLPLSPLTSDTETESCFENDAENRLPLPEAPLRIDFDEFPRAIPVPAVTPELARIFNADTEGTYIPNYTQDDMSFTLDGYVTSNLDFYQQVLEPVLQQKRDSLLTLEKYQAVNALTLFMQESFQDFFGLSYYRWGGDITDRDQPQVAGHTRSTKRYGMDCSGFAASAYEAAVMLEILDSTRTEARFSWFGFKHLCETNAAFQDGGGRSGTTNNYRLEVFEMANIGREIAVIPAGQTPTDEQLALMQAGDLVIKSGHTGILVEIQGALYFLESGGGTLSENGLYTPFRAKEAIANFASSRTTTIYRCLPDKNSGTGIVHY